MAKAAKTYDVQAVGRRKASIARVYLKKGTGKITVNKRQFTEYFCKPTNQYVVKQPLNLLKEAENYDVVINVKGGGTSGQAGAARLGISRAMQIIDAGHRAELKAAGFLTRDSRKVERKKYGMAGARRAFQFSKR